MSNLVATSESEMCYSDCHLPAQRYMMTCLGCFKRFHYVCNPTYTLENSDAFICNDCAPLIGPIHISSSQSTSDTLNRAANLGPTSLENIENVLCMDSTTEAGPSSSQSKDKTTQAAESHSASSSQESRHSSQRTRQPLTSLPQAMDTTTDPTGSDSPVLLSKEIQEPRPGPSGLQSVTERQTARKSTGTPMETQRPRLLRSKNSGKKAPPTVASSSSSSSDENEEGQREDDEEEEYEVGDILSHGTKGGEVCFQVNWKGYPPHEKEWIPESRLHNCRAKVVAYRKKKKLGPTKIPRPAAGYVPTTNLPKNTANWVEYEEIIKMIKGYDVNKFADEIPVKIYEDQLDEMDSIYIIPIGSHAATGLYLARNRIMFIGDGANEIVESEDYSKQAKDMLGVDMKPIRIIGQRGVDHCATSAALIALSFMRLYVKGHQMPREISLPRSVQESMVRTYHKERSHPITEWKSVNENLIIDICPNCGKTFRSKRNAYLSHSRLCKPK